MEKWEIALQKFISKWENRKDVVGALVFGSYITGNPGKHSDIDVQIILDSKVDWRERGNEVIDGFLIEYFANPSRKYYDYAKEDFQTRTKVNSHMFSTGKIIFDKTGELNKIVEYAKKDMTKKYPKLSKAQTEISKYHIWDMYDNLEEVFNSDRKEFFLVYYNNLNLLFKEYSNFLCFDSVPIYKFVKNIRNSSKYYVGEFPDNDFVKMYVDAIELDDKSKMMAKYKSLTEHVRSEMGGFDIDGWKIRTPVQ